MLKLRTFAALLALSTAVPAHAQDASTVVATVNGTDITLGHMVAMQERLTTQYQNMEDERLFAGILEQLVRQTALGAQADELSARSELVIENERRALLASEVLQRLASDAVTDQQVQDAYNGQFGNVDPSTEYNASHILVETEEEAQALIDQLNNDGADFAELAMANSTGPSGPSGGELGWFGAGAMVGAFDAAVQAMSVDEIAGPVQTQFGWHVIKLNETRQNSIPTLEEARAEIERRLESESMANIVASAMESAEISETDTEIDPALIRNGALLD